MATILTPTKHLCKPLFAEGGPLPPRPPDGGRIRIRRGQPVAAAPLLWGVTHTALLQNAVCRQFDVKLVLFLAESIDIYLWSSPGSRPRPWRVSPRLRRSNWIRWNGVREAETGLSFVQGRGGIIVAFLRSAARLRPVITLEVRPSFVGAERRTGAARWSWCATVLQAAG